MVKFESMKFMVLLAAAIAMIGAAAAFVVPPVAVVAELLAFVVANFFFWRYFLAKCPSCGERFASVMRVIVAGLMKQSQCQNCGLSMSILAHDA